MIHEKEIENHYSKAKGSEYDKLKKFGDRTFNIRREEKETYSFMVFKYEKRSYFCIWYRDETDCFWTEHDALVYFDTLEKAKAYCVEHEISFVDEVTHINVVAIQQWICGKVDIDGEVLIDFWNSLTDLTESLDVDYIGDDDGEYEACCALYEKLFYSYSLPSSDTSTVNHIVNWEEDDINYLKQIITQGIRLFGECFAENDV